MTQPKPTLPTGHSLLDSLPSPLVRLLRLDRRLWRRRVDSLVLDGGWKKAYSKVEQQLHFFAKTPYRPSYESLFDDERKLLVAALAVANQHYFDGDLKAYLRTVLRVGSYLEHAARSEPRVQQSDIWAEYLHHKATIEHINGHPSNAATLNSSVHYLFKSKNGRELDALTYEGCTICCRVESLSAQEQYLITSLNGRVDAVAQFLREASEKASSPDDLNDCYTREFYVRMLECKLQAHMLEHADPSVLEAALSRAKFCRSKISGTDAARYDVVIHFYEALLSMLRREAVSHTTMLYEKALAALRASNAPYFCLLRVPDALASSLAEYVQRQKLFPDRALAKLRRVESRWFLVRTFTVLAAAFVVPIVANMLAPLPQLGKGLTSPKGSWFAVLAITTGTASVVTLATKLLAERTKHGLISPTVLVTTDIACWAFMALAVTLFGAAAAEVITLP